jgi:GMP synthase (glutamine-hydrolysing)
MTEFLKKSMAKPFLIIQHFATENPGRFGEILERSPLKTHLVCTYAGEKVPTEARGFSGMLIMGGPMNVEETVRYLHLLDEMRLIREFYRMETPVLGICLGAQLAAASFGAPVYTGKTKEIGWYELTLTGEGRKDSLFEGFPETFKVFQLHSQTFDLPSGAVLLASSPDYPHQAFRLGKCLWGLQFHLEATGNHIRRWIEDSTDDLAGCPDLDPRRVIADIPLYESFVLRLADKLFERFLKYVCSLSGKW